MNRNFEEWGHGQKSGFVHQLMIGSIAKNVHMLSSQVIWSQMALEAAKAEGKSPALISKIKKVISQAILEHDQVTIWKLKLNVQPGANPMNLYEE